MHAIASCHGQTRPQTGLYAVSAVLDSQEAYLPVCYDQWWTSCVAGCTAGHTMYMYILFELKRSHHCLVCTSKARQGARKVAVTSKWCQNFWMKRFQQKPHNKNLENTIKNPIKLCFWRKNEVSSRFCRNRQTDRHTHTQTEWLHVPRVKKKTSSYSPGPNTVCTWDSHIYYIVHRSHYIYLLASLLPNQTLPKSTKELLKRYSHSRTWEVHTLLNVTNISVSTKQQKIISR